MATATRKVRVVRKHHPRAAGQRLPIGVPVNVKVKGERTMRKGVVLTTHPSDPFRVTVHTGRRGRPAFLAIENIERFRVL